MCKRPLVATLTQLPLLRCHRAALMQLQLFLCPVRTCQDPLTGQVVFTTQTCPAATNSTSDMFYW